MPAALEGIDWEAAKTALAMGARMEDVASDLGIKFRALQKRAQRGKWLISHTLLKRAQRAREDAQASGSTPETLKTLPGVGVSRAVSKVGNETESREKAGALALQTLERNDQKISLLSSGMALRSVEVASKRKKALPINSVQDLDKALMISKRAAGKDKPDTAVTLALFGGHAGPMPEAARGFRVKVHEAEEITNGEG